MCDAFAGINAVIAKIIYFGNASGSLTLPQIMTAAIETATWQPVKLIPGMLEGRDVHAACMYVCPKATFYEENSDPEERADYLHKKRIEMSKMQRGML